MIAARRQADRVGRQQQRERDPVLFAERVALAQDAVVLRRRLDREADRLEPADELANVLPHLCRSPAEGQLASFGLDRCSCETARTPLAAGRSLDPLTDGG
jgi:hypothetical protein